MSDNLDHDGRLERTVERHYADNGREQASEEVDEMIEDLLLEDVSASEDFLCFILGEGKDKQALGQLINEWLNTPYGVRWYEAKVEAVMRPMEDDEPEEDR